MRWDQLPELMRNLRLEMVGIVLLAGGFVASLVTWLGIRTVNNPAAQFPVIVSGGLLAIGLFLAGAALLTAGLVARQIGHTGAERSEDRPMWYQSNGHGLTRTLADELDLPTMPEDVRDRRASAARRHAEWETAG